VTRRTPIVLLVALVATIAAATVAHAGGYGGYGALGSVTPGSGPPGTEISYTVVGTSPNADAECRSSSAFSTEFLAADGVRLATGADTITVPETATPGPGFLRLICYLGDETGRPVIYGACVAFEVTAPGTPPGAPRSEPDGSAFEDPCPPSARVVASQSVLHAASVLGRAFNQVIKPLGG
jgi:hypothetical protein